MGDAAFTTKVTMFLYARPMFRTVDWACNYGARFLEGRRGLAAPEARAALGDLNDIRAGLQGDLHRLTETHGGACADCKGWCCSEERFRDAFVDRVLQDPQTPNRAPRSRKKVVRETETAYPPLRGLAPREDFPAEYCPNCTPQGCLVPYEDRPIQCTAFYCWSSIQCLSEQECRTAIAALGGLMGVMARTAVLAWTARA